MNPGDPVRISQGPRKRKLRGIVLEVLPDERVQVWPIERRAWPQAVGRDGVEVIREPNERHLVLTKHEARQRVLASIFVSRRRRAPA